MIPPNATIEEAFNILKMYLELKIEDKDTIEFHKAMIMLINSKKLFAVL